MLIEWLNLASQVAVMVKNPHASAGEVKRCSFDHPLEESIATHSSILAWRIPWTEGPGGLESRGSQRVGHNRSDLTHTECTQRAPKHFCIL